MNRTILICLCLSLCSGCAKLSKFDGQYESASKDIFLKADINEQLIYKGNDVIIRAVSLDMNAPEGPVLVFSGKNMSNRECVVTLKYCSVNNIMIEPDFKMIIEPSGDAMAEAVFPERFLLTTGIQTFSSISFIARIADASDSRKYIDTDQINILTSMSGKYTQKKEFTGTQIVDSNGVRLIVGRNPDFNSPLNRQIYIYADNSSSEDIVLEIKELRVNGIKMEPFFIETICAGKTSWAPLTFRDSDIVENGIISIEELVISFRVVSVFGTIIDTDGCQILFNQETAV